MTQAQLFPLDRPRRAEWIATGDGHDIYVEESGAADGLAVIFLHGGPGGGCKSAHRQFFDPRRYRVFLLDQRGCGRSKPFGATEGNTLATLISDLELVRTRFGVQKWVLFGGSWGATLALAYAQTHPDNVAAIVLRGTFLARERDLQWFIGGGAGQLLPQAWAEFQNALGGPKPYSDIIDELHRNVLGPDKVLAEHYARAWSRWSTHVVMYAIDNFPADPPVARDEVIAKTAIELHYAKHRYFLYEDQLLREMTKVPLVPTRIIHGQRDITCCAEAGFLVHKRLAHSRFGVLRNAGHLSGEPAMAAALVAAAQATALELES